MRFLIYGTRTCGRVDRAEDLFHVVTRFGHLWYFPVLPLGSRLVVTAKNGPSGELKIPLQGRSVLAAYARSYGGLAATLAGAASSFFLADAVLLSVHSLLPLGVWVASLLLMQLAVRLPLRFAILPGLLWLAGTAAMVTLGYQQNGTFLAQPRCWAAVGGCVGLIWISDYLWRRASAKRALELAEMAKLPAELVLDRMPVAPGAARERDAVPPGAPAPGGLPVTASTDSKRRPASARI